MTKQAISTAGGVDTIVSAMKACPDAPVVQQMGCMVLRNLSVNCAATCHMIASTGGYEQIIRSLEAYPDDEELQEQGRITLKVGNAAIGVPTPISSQDREELQGHRTMLMDG